MIEVHLSMDIDISLLSLHPLSIKSRKRSIPPPPLPLLSIQSKKNNKYPHVRIELTSLQFSQ
jgi:hypothetical protein